jgi:hypothetical protein
MRFNAPIFNRDRPQKQQKAGIAAGL